MYEEKVIDGVLSFRNNPTESWIKFTDKELTTKLLESRRYNDSTRVYGPIINPHQVPDFYPEYKITC